MAHPPLFANQRAEEKETMNYMIGSDYEYQIDGSPHTGTIVDIFVMCGKLYFKVKEDGFHAENILVTL